MSVAFLHHNPKTDLWETPPDFFAALDAEFGFTLDACALPENAQCKRFYSPEEDGLSQPWTGVVWCNPPYGRNVGRWLKKARESARGGATVVCLVFARTDTAWFHELIWDAARNQPQSGVETRFLRGRLKFGEARLAAPHGSLLVVFRPEEDADDACSS
jgi:phage N-6-adenine-methyltransferase